MLDDDTMALLDGVGLAMTENVESTEGEKLALVKALSDNNEEYEGKLVTDGQSVPVGIKVTTLEKESKALGDTDGAPVDVTELKGD